MWLNPPYSQPLLTYFCERFVENRNGIALIFARTGNKVWQELMLPRCDAVLFLRKRIRFYLPDGTQGAGAGCDSALFAIGEENVEALMNCGLEGSLVILNDVRRIQGRRPSDLDDRNGAETGLY